MKVELKEISMQLGELLGLSDGYRVAACFDEEGSDDNIRGWCVVRVDDNGVCHREGDVYGSIKELCMAYLDIGA